MSGDPTVALAIGTGSLTGLGAGLLVSKLATLSHKPLTLIALGTFTGLVVWGLVYAALRRTMSS